MSRIIKKGEAALNAFKQQNNQNSFSKLERRFNKSVNTWCEQYQSLRVLAFLISWAFNLISALGLAYLVFHALMSFGMGRDLAIFFSVLFLALFELVKRKTSDLFWDDYVATKSPNIGLGVINFVVIFGLSLAGTYNGYDQGTKDFSPEYEAQKTNDNIDRIDSEILALQTENIEVHQKTADKKGQMRWNNEVMFTKNNERIAELNKQIDIERASLSELEEENGTEFEKGITLGIDTIMYIAIGSEIAFEFLMWFMSFFDFRKRIEIALSLGIPLEDVLNTSSIYSSTGSQQVAQEQNSSYQQVPSNATQQAAQQPISENKSRIGFHIPKNGFVSDQKRVTQADTQPDTEVTQKPETRVPHGTRPDTEVTRPQKDPDYIIKMKKRIRQRWARSFPEHAKSPKNKGMRSNLKELALEEWRELEEMGYKITKDATNVPWGLDIVSPQKRS